MIRTLFVLAGVGLVVAVICFAAAFAIVGGPFYIDDDGHFHREAWSDVSVERHPPKPIQLHIS
jgi:hypothetical protein